MVRITFDRPVVDPATGGPVQLSNFFVRESGSRQPPQVYWLREYPARTYSVLLSRSITPGECTTLIPQVASAEGALIRPLAQNRVTIGFLPGDVTGNGQVNSGDGSLFLAQLRNTQPSSLVRDDINRDGIISVADLSRLINLFQGVLTSRPWLGATLPSCPTE